MKLAMTLCGIVLIVLGGLSFAYHGFSYTKQEQVAQLGSLKVTADTEKNVTFPPVFGGLAIVAGIVLVVAGSMGGGNKK